MKTLFVEIGWKLYEIFNFLLRIFKFTGNKLFKKNEKETELHFFLFSTSFMEMGSSLNRIGGTVTFRRKYVNMTSLQKWKIPMFLHSQIKSDLDGISI